MENSSKTFQSIWHMEKMDLNGFGLCGAAQHTFHTLTNNKWFSHSKFVHCSMAFHGKSSNNNNSECRMSLFHIWKRQKALLCYLRDEWSYGTDQEETDVSKCMLPCHSYVRNIFWKKKNENEQTKKSETTLMLVWCQLCTSITNAQHNKNSRSSICAELLLLL